MFATLQAQDIKGRVGSQENGAALRGCRFLCVMLMWKYAALFAISRWNMESPHI